MKPYSTVFPIVLGVALLGALMGALELTISEHVLSRGVLIIFDVSSTLSIGGIFGFIQGLIIGGIIRLMKPSRRRYGTIIGIVMSFLTLGLPFGSTPGFEALIIMNLLSCSGIGFLFAAYLTHTFANKTSSVSE